MKENFIKFYVNKFNYIKNNDNVDVSFLSPILKRRLGKLDKGTISMLNKTFDDGTENIVFSSQTGELERLLKIIEQYSSYNEVSPNTFTGSVHNYPVGFFLMNTKNTIPYTAVSAGDNSISEGILASVISACEKTLFCYSDIYNNELISFSISVSKKPVTNSQAYKLILCKNDDRNDIFENYIRLFSGKDASVKSDIFKIERVNNA